MNEKYILLKHVKARPEANLHKIFLMIITLACVADTLNLLYRDGLDEYVGRLQRRLHYFGKIYQNRPKYATQYILNTIFFSLYHRFSLQSGRNGWLTFLFN